MARRLKPIKDLSVLILAQRKHDRQLWTELLKNCGINSPQSMSDIEQAATAIGSGQADVVFVDDSYGAQGIAQVLIPARNVEFAGGRGVCLILCSKKATAQDVLNARKLGFASLVILPASTDTVRKHLELAARYIPPSDEELGWSAPKVKETQESKGLPEPKDDPASQNYHEGNGAVLGGAESASAEKSSRAPTPAQDSPSDQPIKANINQTKSGPDEPSAQVSETEDQQQSDQPPNQVKGKSKTPRPEPDEDLPQLNAPGRSGNAAEEEVVFL